MKRVFAIVLSVLLLLSCSGIAYAGNTSSEHDGIQSKQYHNCPSKGYSDVPPDGHWAHAGIDFMVEKGYMNGVGGDKFSPDGNVTRAQLVTILYRISGSPETAFKGTFTDVNDDQWYSLPIEWAAANGIVNGVGDGRFNPEGKITREQIAAILYRYSGSPKAEGDLNSFLDESIVSGYAVNSLIWATQQKLINGIGSGNMTYLAPRNNATRAQIAVILFRFKNDEANNPVCEHNYVKGDTVAPTCVTSGGTTYTCAKCGYSYFEEASPALGHDFDPITNICTRCGEIEAVK